MSDEHKPHDDHGHDHGHAPAHDDHAAAPAGDHGHAAEAHGGHDDHVHAADAAHHDDHGHGAGAAHHDDHGHGAGAAHHDDHGHEAHAAGHHDDYGHEAHAAHHDDHGHAADAGHHGDHGHGGDAAHHDDHGHGHAAHHDDHGHAAAAAHDDHGHGDHGHGDPHLTPAEATAAAVIAGGAAVAASHGEKRPVWSDSGDAPFEDVDATPVYARNGKRDKRKKGGGNEVWEIVKTIAFALLIALVLRTLLFQPFTIPSASMEPNLYEGDYIVVSKWSYGYSRHSLPLSPNIFSGRIFAQAPHRGDIVVFKLPRDDGHGPNTTDYIKRLIGLPGDKIQMISNVLYINGQPVRDVVMSREDVAGMYQGPVIHSRETFPDGSKSFDIQDWGPGNTLDDTPVLEVPQGYYFMMGDNRDNSIDSRVDQSSGVGFVPAENLIGKAQMILFSWSPGVNKNPVTWFTKLRPSRFFTVLD